jgi:hypothetical protein
MEESNGRQPNKPEEERALLVITSSSKIMRTSD